MAVIATPNAAPPSQRHPGFPDNALAVTPNDVDTFESPVTIYVGVAGTVVCVPAGKQAQVTCVVPAGGVVPFRVGAVKTASTAASMLAVY